MRPAIAVALLLFATVASGDAITTVSRLRKLRYDAEEVDLSPRASVLIARLKRELREEARAALARHARVARTYGGDGPYAFEVRAETLTSGEVVVITMINVPCGDDESLYVFRCGHIVVSHEAPPYAMVTGAQTVLRYAATATHIAIASVNTACVSNWQELHFRLLRLGDGALLLDRRESIFNPYDEGYELALTSSALTLRFLTRFKIDVRRLVRKRTMRYTLDPVTRVPPFGNAADEFIDEWATLPWPVAVCYAPVTARAWHTRLHEAENAEVGDIIDHGGAHEVEVTIDGVTVVFTVRGEGEAMRITAVQRAPT